MDTTQTRVVMKESTRMIGVKYNYALTSINFIPHLGQKGISSPFNISLLYTYYHPLWGYMDYFGIQTGIKYGSYGYSTDADWPEFSQTITAIEIPLISSFKFDAGENINFLLGIGTFGGYRLSSTREFDENSRKFDYGLIGSAGLAFKFKKFEIHLEGSYHYHFGFVFNPYIIDPNITLISNPTEIGINLGFHYKLGNGR